MAPEQRRQRATAAEGACPSGACSGPLQSGALLSSGPHWDRSRRCAAFGADSMAMLSAAASPFCRIAPEGAFCKAEEDPFLLLKSNLKAIERILQVRRGQPPVPEDAGRRATGSDRGPAPGGGPHRSDRVARRTGPAVAAPLEDHQLVGVALQEQAGTEQGHGRKLPPNRRRSRGSCRRGIQPAAPGHGVAPCRSAMPCRHCKEDQGVAVNGGPPGAGKTAGASRGQAPCLRLGAQARPPAG